MGTRRATIKRNAPVIMMGQGATLTEKISIEISI